MEQIKEIIKFDDLRNKIDNSTRKFVEEKTNEIFKDMPSQYKRLGSPFYIALIVLTFFLIIPILIYRMQLKAMKEYVKEKLDLKDIYSIAMDQISELDFQDIVETQDRNDLYALRIDRIPGDAKITKATDVIRFKLLKKYDTQIRTGLGLWIRRYGKNTQVYTCPTGYIQIQTPGLLPSFQYSLFHRDKLLSKGDLMEDPLFNKSFSFDSNDKIQSRVMYTPLTMEKTIEHKANIDLAWWVVEKKSNVINIRFRPKKWNAAEIEILARNNTPKKFIEYTINEISSDVYLIYKLLELVLIPNLL